MNPAPPVTRTLIPAIPSLHSGTPASGGARRGRDSFSSTALSGWTVIDEAANGPSAWSVSNGVLVQKSAIGSTASGDTIGTFALYTQMSWTDYRLSLTMKSNDDDAIGVMFRFKDYKNYYRFTWDKTAGLRRLEKRVNGTFTTLASSSGGYNIGQNYQVTMVAQGSSLKVAIDGQQIFSVTDTAHASGTVALYSSQNAGSLFDNVLVEDLKTGELKGPGQAKTRFGVSMVRGLTPFVGRKKELAHLVDCFELVKKGQGQLVGIGGEAGVGKSRLLRQMIDTLPPEECLYLEGGCLHYGEAVAYLPILGILKSLFGIDEHEDQSVAKKKISSRMEGLKARNWRASCPRSMNCFRLTWMIGGTLSYRLEERGN